MSLPPFDPPYLTLQETEGITRLVETRADGSTIEVPVDDVILRLLHGQGNVTTSMAKRAAATPRPETRGRNAALYLTVPFAEKNEAKALGAKWDATARKWYVPHGVDVNLFTPWWPVNLKEELDRLAPCTPPA